MDRSTSDLCGFKNDDNVNGLLHENNLKPEPTLDWVNFDIAGEELTDHHQVGSGSSSFSSFNNSNILFEEQYDGGFDIIGGELAEHQVDSGYVSSFCNQAILPMGHHGGRKVLVHVPTDEVIDSYELLEEKLLGSGWERNFDTSIDLRGFHKPSSSMVHDHRLHFIFLPKDLTNNFKYFDMYNLVAKNSTIFQVRYM